MTIKKTKKLFLDEEGQLNMAAVVDLMQQLPDAIKMMPLDKLQELLPVLQAAIAAAQPAEAEPATEEIVDAEYPAPEEPVAEEKKKMQDTAEFKNAVLACVKAHSKVIEHASKFLDVDYIFSEKTTEQIMRDSLATEYGKLQFVDAELQTAFKMLKRTRSDSLRNFGDSSRLDKFAALAEKEF